MEKYPLHPVGFCSNAGMNGVSAANVLENVKKSLEAELSGRLYPVIELARNLPPLSGNMLELHFNRSEAPFDFAFRINEQYDGPLFQPALLQDKFAPAVWEGYKQLFHAPMPGFRYGIENVCFEYDFPFQTLPALFIDLHRDMEFTPGKTLEDLKELAAAFQQPIYEELAGFFAKIKEAGLHVVYAGFMLSRKARSIRFTIEGVTFNTLMKTIIALGWKGNYDVLDKLQQTYMQANQRLVLCGDFDRQLGHKLGIEVHAPHWKPLIEKLFTNRICNEEQNDLLKNWYGKTALSHHLSKELSYLHQRAITCVYRRINHFKFTLEADAITTKAYLYYCF